MNRKERRAKAKHGAGAGAGVAIPSLLSAAVQAHRSGRPGETVEFCRRVLAADPNQADALHLLAIVTLTERKPEEARRLIAKAVKVAPDRADLHNTLGSAWLALLKPEQAILAFEEAIRLMPGYFDAHINLGEALRRADRTAEAEQVLRRTLELRPGDAETANKLGALLIELERWPEAEEMFRLAVRTQADHVGAWLYLGAACDHDRRTEEAVAALEKVLELVPGHVRAIARLIRPYQTLCAWDRLARIEPDLDSSTDRILAAGGMPAEDPFLNLSRHSTPERNLEIARSWSADLERRNGKGRPMDRRKTARSEGLTIGYLSSDFTDHPVGHLVGGLFARHRRPEFRIVALSVGPDDGSRPRQRIESDCDTFVDLRGLPNREAAARIRDENIDILVELNGLTLGTRLGICARRPAPLQVTWLGYPGTTGATFIDYLIADRTAVPPEHEAYFSEKILRLPDCLLPAIDLEPPARTGLTRTDAGLPEKAVVFCSFNQSYKIEAELFAAWTEILRAVPGSVLWLGDLPEPARSTLRSALQAGGLAPERLVFAPRIESRAGHLERVGLADIALDTWTYGGHSTSVDALWAGVPVVTRLGRHLPSRICASVVAAAGLPELVTESAESYRATAVELALDPQRLRGIRDHLSRREPVPPLFDGSRFVAHLEESFRRIWERHRQGREPVSQDVDSGVAAGVR